MSGGIGGLGAARDVGPAGSGPYKAVDAGAAAPPEAAVVRGSAPARLAPAGPSKNPDPRVEALKQAMRTEPADKLEKTIEKAKKQDPTAYRTAIREHFKEIGFEPSKLVAHMMAMDANRDGKVTFSESYKTMHGDMGFSAARAFLLAGLTATLLAPQTSDKFSFAFNVANADKVERSFFRTAFDTDAALEERLDEVFAEDLDKDGFIDQKDFDRLVDKRTAKMDSKLGAKIINKLNKSEWQGLLSLMDNHRINRDELRDFYNSSLFFSFLEPGNLAKKLVAYRAPGGIK